METKKIQLPSLMTQSGEPNPLAFAVLLAALQKTVDKK